MEEPERRKNRMFDATAAPGSDPPPHPMRACTLIRLNEHRPQIVVRARRRRCGSIFAAYFFACACTSGASSSTDKVPNQPIIISCQVCGPHFTVSFGLGLARLFSELSK